MRTLLFRITLTLVCASWASATWAAEVLPNAKTSPIIHSWAHPDGVRVPNATHHVAPGSIWLEVEMLV